MELRNYQKNAVQSVISHFKESNESAVLTLPTGAGKSLIISKLSQLANNRVLVLAHVKELVEQNSQKFKYYGLNYSIFSAGLSQKNSSAKVVFGTVQSVAKNLSNFNQKISLLIIDECHRVGKEKNSEYLKIINYFRLKIRNLKILGLTATPYRTDLGWIYKYHYNGYIQSEKQTPFSKCIFDLPISKLIREGYLSTPIQVNPPKDRYKFNTADDLYNYESLNKQIEQSPRITKAIIEHLKKIAQERLGVMIFASSIQHASEIHTYLGNESYLITGNTSLSDREAIISGFKNQNKKFLINVSVLTTGFDAPHVDLIAILRKTESVSLYQQIVGRGLRLHPKKTNCIVIDYAANNHDIFQPEIGKKPKNPNVKIVQVQCPICGFQNLFWGILDPHENIIEHYGRKCKGININQNKNEQCSHYFKSKECPQCGTTNDIAARKCSNCNFQLIDHDNILKKAYDLSNQDVFACAGITYSSTKNGVFLTYHDENGQEFTEITPQVHTEAFHEFFKPYFSTQKIQNFSDFEKYFSFMKYPDFLILEKRKLKWVIIHKIFDYVGLKRKANQI